MQMQCCWLSRTGLVGAEIKRQAACAPLPVPLFWRVVLDKHDPDRVPIMTVHTTACQCSAIARRQSPSSVSTSARCSSHIPSSAALFRSVPFDLLGSRLYQYVSIHPLYTSPLSWPRACQGTAGLLAISPPKRFITLERPVSLRFG
jgi:hypothetical protein